MIVKNGDVDPASGFQPDSDLRLTQLVVQGIRQYRVFASVTAELRMPCILRRTARARLTRHVAMTQHKRIHAAPQHIFNHRPTNRFV